MLQMQKMHYGRGCKPPPTSKHYCACVGQHKTGQMCEEDFSSLGTTLLTFSMIFCSQESMASIIVHKQLKVASTVIALLGKCFSILCTTAIQ